MDPTPHPWLAGFSSLSGPVHNASYILYVTVVLCSSLNATRGREYQLDTFLFVWACMPRPSTKSQTNDIA